jgi:hypothetical protein
MLCWFSVANSRPHSTTPSLPACPIVIPLQIYPCCWLYVAHSWHIVSRRPYRPSGKTKEQSALAVKIFFFVFFFFLSFVVCFSEPWVTAIIETKTHAPPCTHLHVVVVYPNLGSSLRSLRVVVVVTAHSFPGHKQHGYSGGTAAVRAGD